MAKKRKRYTEEFKREAVRLVEEEGYKTAEAARNLGISESMLHRWRKNDSESGSEKQEDGLSQSEKEELKRLRAENNRLKMERDILKKAAAFFAKESL